MVDIPDLKNELADEVGNILSQDFTINVTSTRNVPSPNDGSITFPNLDARSQNCKLLETCILYIDIRRSTELNLAHRPNTVAKLYSAFVRAMTKCARHYNGHVRGIIGDRVMVIFNTENAFSNAVNTAVLMNSTAKFVINKHFRQNEIQCGIGIDAGKILATKTGFIRRGIEQHNYRSLVWLGRPANVASKLTDIANKPQELKEIEAIRSGYYTPFGWYWRDDTVHEFFDNMELRYLPARMVPTRANWEAAFAIWTSETMRPATPPILMTQAVFDGYRKASPNAPAVVNDWYKQVPVSVAGYDGNVFGGDVIFSAFAK